MSIVDELIASVRADVPVRRVQIAPFWTAVLADRCGLASTSPAGSHSHERAPVVEAGRLTERSGLELARLARSGSPLEAAVGVAAINALLEVDEAGAVELNARDLLVERGRGKKVALVGHFPFAQALRQAVGHLSVLELDPRPGDMDAREAELVIPEADVVAITGSSFVNGTVDRLLGLCRKESFVVVLGPSTPLSPILFDYGVDVLSGTVVSDVETAMRCVAEGATFRQIRGVRMVSLFREGAEG
jgi:uncharacterized protein